MTSKFVVAAVQLSAQSLLAIDALAASRTVHMHFNAGSSSATIKGSITGYETANYLPVLARGR
jgi:hypothetical protein